MLIWKNGNQETAHLKKNRANVPFESISDYYKKSITIPLLDNFNSDMQTRFNTDAVTAYHGLSILPAKVVSKDPVKSNLTWRQQFSKFCNLYNADLPNPTGLSGELNAWENDWLMSKVPPPISIPLTLKLVNFDGYNNIKEALKILGTLPVTSCECERSFSSLKLLKSFNRTILSTERLNGLALVYIHQEQEPNIDKILTKFSLMKDRRLEMI